MPDQYTRKQGNCIRNHAVNGYIIRNKLGRCLACLQDIARKKYEEKVKTNCKMIDIDRMKELKELKKLELDSYEF